MEEKRVLIIDDEDFIRNLISNALKIKFQKLQIYQADSSKGGTRLISESEITELDIVFCDIDLEVFEAGFILIPALRAKFPNSFIIAMSGRDFEARKDKALKCGADVFFSKPFNLNEMLHALS